MMNSPVIYTADEKKREQTNDVCCFCLQFKPNFSFFCFLLFVCRTISLTNVHEIFESFLYVHLKNSVYCDFIFLSQFLITHVSFFFANIFRQLKINITKIIAKFTKNKNRLLTLFFLGKKPHTIYKLLKRIQIVHKGKLNC